MKQKRYTRKEIINCIRDIELRNRLLEDCGAQGKLDDPSVSGLKFIINHFLVWAKTDHHNYYMKWNSIFKTADNIDKYINLSKLKNKDIYYEIY